MNHPLQSHPTYSILFVLVILMTGLFFTSVASADYSMGQGMEHADRPQAMDYKGKPYCKHRGEPEQHWKYSLTDEQKAKISQIKVAYMKEKLPLKARKEALNLELMALATAEDPDGAAIDAKIDELLRVKKSLLLAKARKIADIRAQLTEEQRAGFDLYVLEKAEHRK